MTHYKGIRDHYGAHVIVTENGNMARLKHIRRHSPCGFEWGYVGSAPKDLSYSLLTRHFGGGHEAERRADEVYREFAELCIAKLPYAGWEMDSIYIDEMLRVMSRCHGHEEGDRGQPDAVVALS